MYVGSRGSSTEGAKAVSAVLTALLTAAPAGARAPVMVLIAGPRAPVKRSTAGDTTLFRTAAAGAALGVTA